MAATFPVTPEAKHIPDPKAEIGYGDLLRFRQLILDRTGQAFPDSRRAELEAGIKRAFAASTYRDLEEYYRILLDPVNGVAELERLINFLTVNETHFFRDAAQINALRTKVLPDIIQRRAYIRTIRIWSAGCSTGEEPYTIAMLLQDLLPNYSEWSITILGTDINTQALNRARVGLYPDSAFREELAKKWRSRFFVQRENRYEIIPEVRRMVTFNSLNLASDNFPSYDTNTMLMDLILCRNVTIYFAEDLTRRLVGKFYESLVEDGWLVVGHSEHSLGAYNQFQIHNFPDAILYQRVYAPDNRSLDWKQLEQMLGKRKSAPTPVSASANVRTVPLSRPVMSDADRKNYLQQIAEWMESGENDRALDKLIALEKEDRENPELCVMIGKIHAGRGEWARAEEWCLKTIRNQKLDREAHYILALVYQHQGKIEEAVAEMKKVVYIDSTHILGHVGLADLYHIQKDMRQALKSLDNARKFLIQGNSEDIVENSGGISKRVLLDLVVHRQQQWYAENS
jgi:chemotaxis protein methyltransferase CheR